MWYVIRYSWLVSEAWLFNNASALITNLWFLMTVSVILAPPLSFIGHPRAAPCCHPRPFFYVTLVSSLFCHPRTWSEGPTPCYPDRKAFSSSSSSERFYPSSSSCPSEARNRHEDPAIIQGPPGSPGGELTRRRYLPILIVWDLSRVNIVFTNWVTI